jgi:hypothetical protein
MGSDFNDFMRQIPFGMIACLCVTGILLAGSVSYIVFARVRRARKTGDAVNKASPSMSTTSASPKTYDTGELPDLDVLLNLSIPPDPAATPERTVKPGTYSVKLADTGEAVQAAEVMVILRDVDEGRLVVQLGDQTYSNLSDFPDSKNRFLKVMKELAGIVTPRANSPVDNAQPSTEAPQAAAPSGLLARVAKNEADDVPSVADLLTTPKEPKQPLAAVPPPPLPDGSMPGDLPKFQLPQMPLAPRRGAGLLRMNKDQERELKKPVPEVNIAQAIQSYLQYKLQHTPQYGGRSINVSPAPGGGVKIEVDGTFYDAVSDVEDAEVREFLAATIQEWQSRQ